MTTTQTGPFLGVAAAPGWEWVKLADEAEPGTALAVPNRVQWAGEVDGARVVATWSVSTDSIECTGLEIRGPVKSSTLRTLGLDGRGREAAAGLAMTRRSVIADLLPDAPIPADWMRGASRVVRQPGVSAQRAADRLADGRGKPAVSHADLVEAARIYNATPQRPAKAVATLMGLEARTASRRIQQARAAGLIRDAPERRVGLTDAELEAVARVYVGAPEAPVAAVAKHLGDASGGKSKRTAARVIAQARERGLIPPLEGGN